MPYQYIQAPDDVEVINKESIFLMGGITNCENWQKQISDLLSVQNDRLTVINPRRDHFEKFKNTSGYLDSEKQIEWECKKIRSVSQLLFWFGKENVQPVALFELGSALERNHKYFHNVNKTQQIFIGMDYNYPRAFDIQIHCKIFNYTNVIADNIQQLGEIVNIYNKNLEYFKK